MWLRLLRSMLFEVRELSISRYTEEYLIHLSLLQCTTCRWADVSAIESILQPCNRSNLHWLYRLWMICSQWVTVVMPDGCSECACVYWCVCVCWSCSVFPAVRSWQALQVAKVRRSPMIHEANSGSPPHLFTTWTQSSCSMLNITWQEAR